MTQQSSQRARPSRLGRLPSRPPAADRGATQTGEAPPGGAPALREDSATFRARPPVPVEGELQALREAVADRRKALADTPVDAVAHPPAPLTSLSAPFVSPPAGQGMVVIPTDARVASSARERAGAPFTGRIAQETLAALERAGGVSYVYVSDHNGNREVVVHASPSFDPARPHCVLLYNRGINGDNAASLTRNHIARTVEELNRNGANILLVMPKSPQPLDHWFAPPEDAGAMLDQALAAFHANTGVPPGPRTETLAMGWSGGGKSLLNLYTHPNAPQVDRFLLADSTYGNWAGDLAAAIEQRAAAGQPAPAIAAVVTDHNRARARAQLARRGIPVADMPGSGRFTGHGGAPSHLLEAALGGAAGRTAIGFSRYVPGTGWIN